MTTTESFAPRRKSTRAVTTGATSTSIPMTLGQQVRVVAGGADCRIEFGKDSSVTADKPVMGAAPGSMLLKAGSVEILTVPTGTEFVAFATDTGTGTLELTPGVGV